jgi:hypothetical protein
LKYTIKIKNIFYTLSVSLGSIFLFLIVLELLFKLVVFIVKGSEKEREIVIKDDKIGWIHNIHTRTVTKKNKCGEEVIRESSKHKLINKFPLYNNEKRIIFIGDSFTHAHEVSTGKAYYDIFEKNMKDIYSVYAAGIGGFGTTQEYMILKSIYDQVQPHIVVWQLSGNDVENNVFELDNASFYNNQKPRPYLNLKNDLIEIKNPGFWLFDLSIVTKYLFERTLILDWKYNLGILNFLNSLIALDAHAIKKYEKEGILVLNRTISKIVREFPHVKLYGFSVDGSYDREYSDIFRKHGAEYFNKFYQSINNTKGTNCAPLDLHWNELGNKISGDRLSILIRRNQNIKK